MSQFEKKFRDGDEIGEFTTVVYKSLKFRANFVSVPKLLFKLTHYRTPVTATDLLEHKESIYERR